MRARRDDAGHFGVHRAFIELVEGRAEKWLSQGIVRSRSLEDLKCAPQRATAASRELVHASVMLTRSGTASRIPAGPVCFESTENGFADGREWVWLQPCRHWLCVGCGQQLVNLRNAAECPFRCDRPLSWGVFSR